jgi:hypothetical protein
LVSEYRFLRFEIVGLATLAFYVVITLPVAFALLRANLRDLGTSFAVISGLFLLSVPLGYWEHQLVVNVYRSAKRKNNAHEVLKRIVLDVESKMLPQEERIFQSLDPTEQAAFLTALEDTCIHSNRMQLDSDVYNRISDRWSHFYAREAITIFAPIVAFVLWSATLVAGYYLKWRMNFAASHVLLSTTIFVAMTITNFALIHPYTRKLWNEICFLESQLLASNNSAVQSIIKSIVKEGMTHHDYFYTREGK